MLLLMGVQATLRQVVIMGREGLGGGAGEYMGALAKYLHRRNKHSYLCTFDQFCLRGELGGWGWDPTLCVSCSIHKNPIKLTK